MVKYGPADSGHHAYDSAARPLRPQIKDGVVLKDILF